MLKVALTGSAGSGKTIVCNRFEKSGINVIDTDRLARDVVTPESPLLTVMIDRFGSKILKPDGSLDRQHLRKIILANESDRIALEQLIHPEVLKRMNAEMAELEHNGADMVLVEVPLLFEAGFEKHFNLVVMVSADDDLKVKRLMARDRVSHDSALALLRAQLPDTEKIHRSDYNLLNNGSKRQFIQEVDRLIEVLKQKITKTA